MDFHALMSTFNTEFTDKDWAEFLGYLHRRRQTRTSADDIVITCDVCCDDTYWAANGGPVARWFACGPLGLGCPACP